MNWMKLLIILVILLAHKIDGQQRVAKSSKKISAFDSSKPLKCDNETNQRLDTSLHKLLHQKFPTNGRELRQFCNQGYKSIAFIQAFIKQCLPDFSQKVISVVFFPINREMSSICKTGRTSVKAKELIKAAKCGNAARPGLARCYRKFIASQMAIKQAQTSKRIPMLCCEFNRLRDCFKGEAEEVKECTSRTIDYVERWATEIFGEIMDLMCYEYPPASDKCDKVILNIPKINLNGVILPKSFLSPLMDIMGDLGAEDAKELL